MVQLVPQAPMLTRRSESILVPNDHLRKKDGNRDAQLGAAVREPVVITHSLGCTAHDSLRTAGKVRRLPRYDYTVLRKHWNDLQSLSEPQPKHPDNEQRSVFLVVGNQWRGLFRICSNQFSSGLGRFSIQLEKSGILRQTPARKYRKSSFSFF
ncbi:unnamed protein product [Heligmosomoides polygyrus]|uniref:Uncharacterized protein n=1 Tax=Heligmosomoides polygyrus TaxID=6339 RepID=A0A183GMU5_HELPZ|nr:unnamed protein product [Heligmosomoides polygyrus]